MPELFGSLQGVPRVPIEIQDDGLRNEQRGIDQGKNGKEVIDQPLGQPWIGGQQHEDKEAAGQRCHAVEDRRDVRHLPRQPFVTGVSLFPTQYFAHRDEDRRAENEGGKQNMELCHDPDRFSVAAKREFMDWSQWYLRSGSRRPNQEESHCDQDDR